jgi:glycine cleavage system aminomethyltransferase T
MYLQQVDDRFNVGSYRHEPVIVDPELIDDTREAPADLDWDESVMASGWAEAGRLVPAIARAGRTKQLYGMFSFTPDTNALLGEVHGVTGLFVAEAIWVTHGPGSGRAIADLMTTGTTDFDLRELDVNRFGRHAWARSYVRARGAQNYREVYDIIHPRDVLTAPRGLRRTPFYERQKELGAVFTESAGWERPNWFEANAHLPVPAGAERTGWNTTHWSPIAAAEHIATRTTAGLFDMSTFTKMSVTGPNALAAMERISCSTVDKPELGVSYALFLNERGGVETDLVVVRSGKNAFTLLCGAGSGQRDLAWVASQLRGIDGVHLAETTSASSALGLWGPNARAIVQSLTDTDIADAGFPRFTQKRLFVGGCPVSLIRISYVGEEGYELHTPTEFGGHLWEAVWEAGQAHGMVACGLTAMDSLRIEKGMLGLGTDLRAEYSPYEAGLGFAVDRKRTSFIGCEALQSRPVEKKLATMTFDDPAVVVIGKEPILHGGEVVGYVSSANFGYTIGKSIALGYVPVDLAEPRTELEIEWFGQRFAATVQRVPLWA